MRKSGFTTIEIMIVMIIVGIIAALGIPRIRDAIQKQNVRSARVTYTMLVAKARAAAVERGCRSALFTTSGSNGRAWVTACRVSGIGRDTLGGIDPIASRYGITVTAGKDSVTFDPRGIAIERVTTVIHFQSGTIKDSIVVNPLGKVTRL